MSALVHYLTLPFHHYAQWVRDNPENAQSLERMTRTMSIFLTDPSHLIKMEGCYAVCKLHSFINQSIMSTSGNAAYRQLLAEQRAQAEEGEEQEGGEGGEIANESEEGERREKEQRQLARRRRRTQYLGFMPLTEAAALLSGMLTELECLLELMVRDFTKNQTHTWYVMILIEAVKVACNSLSSYAQYLFVPFLWRSFWIQLKAGLWRGLTYPSRLLLGASAAAADQDPQQQQHKKAGSVAAAAAKTGNRLAGASVGPNKTRLVIPRVVDSSINNPAAPTAREGEEEEEGGRKTTELTSHVPITGIDMLGVLSDLALLLRPLLLTVAAYAAFPAGSGSTVAFLPRAAAPAPVTAAATTPDGKQLSKLEQRELAVQAEEKVEAERENRLLADALTSDRKRLLQSSWKVWLLFAVFDFLVLILARYIRRHRVPVVYINDNNHNMNNSAIAEAQQQQQHDGESSHRAHPNGGGEAAETNAHNHSSSNTEADMSISSSTNNNNNALQEAGSVPPLVARDAMRVQQAVRNLSFSFLLRDPFFTAMIKPFFNRHLLNGFINKIPLIGGLVHHQASYVLYMQHFSFLYSVGQ